MSGASAFSRSPDSCANAVSRDRVGESAAACCKVSDRWVENVDIDNNWMAKD